MRADMRVTIAGVEFKTPVIAASGTFGFGREYENIIDLDKIGGISLKGITPQKRTGNPPPRIAETDAGMLNSVGLQNPGIEAFIKDILPEIRKYKTVLIANISGNTAEEYADMCERLDDTDIDMIEVNLSCPNIHAGRLLFGTSREGVEQAVGAARRATTKPLIVKLTPNVTDITEPAKAAEASGADAISLINTIMGMAIDLETRRPILRNNTGGLSGPAVKPVALRMVSECARSVKIPIIGMGGINSGRDALEFMVAGASAVMVGTATIIEPDACLRIAREMEGYLEEKGIAAVRDVVNTLQLY